MNASEFEKSLRAGTKVRMVYEALKDQQWHCRECEYTHTGITRIAGGSMPQSFVRQATALLGSGSLVESVERTPFGIRFAHFEFRPDRR